MKKKKGFTLVELLAVIAILAVILLLIVPNIVDMFNNGRKDAFIRQIQSVWRESEKEYTNNVTSEKRVDVFSSTGKTLNLNKTDLTYVASFDIHGIINFIAVGNNKFCYVKESPTSMMIDRSDITDGTLSCTDEGCTCGQTVASIPTSPSVNELRYVYWDGSITGDNTYQLNAYPANALESYNSLAPVFIRTTLDSNNNVVTHDICYNHPNELFCIGRDYELSTEDATYNKLVSDLERLLNISTSESCTKNTEFGIICDFANGYIDITMEGGYVMELEGNVCQTAEPNGGAYYCFVE